jgi:hypothetical protein
VFLCGASGHFFENCPVKQPSRPFFCDGPAMGCRGKGRAGKARPGRGAGTPTSPYPHKHRRETAIPQAPTCRSTTYDLTHEAHRPARTGLPNCTANLPTGESPATSVSGGQLGDTQPAGPPPPRRRYLYGSSDLFICDGSTVSTAARQQRSRPDQHRARVVHRHGAILHSAGCPVLHLRGQLARARLIFSSR